MPDFLCEELQDYISKLYGVFPTDRIFHITKSFLHHEMSREQKLNEVYGKLEALTKIDEAVKLAHVSKIQEKYKKKEKKEVPADEGTEVQKICPKCGAVLVLRTAKKGKNAGKQFYGCSNYPKCRYTIEFSDEENS